MLRNSTSSHSLGANNWLTDSRKCGTMFKPFNAEGLVTFMALYGELMSDAQADAITAMQLESGRNMLARLPGTLDPIWAFGEFDSENYLHMSRLSGLVAERLVPGARGPYYRRFFQDFLANAARAWFRLGRLEWDSQNYAGFNIQPALMAFDHAGNATQQAQARALVDWLLAAAALKTVDGFAIGPDARAKDYCVVPFSGSAWFYVWLALAFDGAEGRAPSFGDAAAVSHADLTTLGQFPTTAYRPPQALLNLAQRRFGGPVLMRNAKPFYRVDAGDYADWRGRTAEGRRFEFETLFLHPAFTLGSLAAGRPNGACAVDTPGLYGNSSLTFSEQSVWRLGAPATAARPTGALEVFGNAGLSPQGARRLREAAAEGGGGAAWEWRGVAPVSSLPFPFGTPAGRSAFEQIGQRRAEMLRVIAGADTAWVGLPSKQAHNVDVGLRPWPPAGTEGAAAASQAAFFSLAGADGRGPAVFVAVLPLGAGPAAALGNYSQAKAAAQTVAWEFDPTRVGALATVVGVPPDHSSLEAFVSWVEANVTLSLVEERRAWDAGSASVDDVPETARLGLTAAERDMSDGGGGGAARLSSGGGQVRLQLPGAASLDVTHTGVGTYTLVDGSQCAPAGLYPRVAVDGSAVDFASFDSWGVVEGEPVMEQAWGSGQLTVQAGGAGLRITVGDDGAVTYEEQ